MADQGTVLLGAVQGTTRNVAKLRGTPTRLNAGATPLRLRELHGNFINLRREDEIVLRQTADGVGPYLDGDVAVADEVEVGMVAFGFGQISAMPSGKSRSPAMEFFTRHSRRMRMPSGVRVQPGRFARNPSASSRVSFGTPPSQGTHFFFVSCSAVRMSMGDRLPGGWAIENSPPRSGTRPSSTSATYCVTALRISAERSAYLRTNFGLNPSNRPKQIGRHDHLAVAVRTRADADRGDRQLGFVIRSATPLGTHSTTRANAPASATARASARIASPSRWTL